MALTDKQQRFVAEYLVDLNATQAAIRAGYAKSGARTEGARLLANADIAALIQQKRAKVDQKAEWSAAERLLALKRITDAAEKADPRVAVSAIAEANKMQGSHAPAKRELSGPNGGPIPVVDLSKATDEQLATFEAFFGPLALSGGDDEGDTDGEAEAGG